MESYEGDKYYNDKSTDICAVWIQTDMFESIQLNLLYHAWGVSNSRC